MAIIRGLYTLSGCGVIIPHYRQKKTGLTPGLVSVTPDQSILIAVVHDVLVTLVGLALIVPRITRHNPPRRVTYNNVKL